MQQQHSTTTKRVAAVVWLYQSEKGHAIPRIGYHESYEEAKAVWLILTAGLDGKSVAAAIFVKEDREDFHPAGHWAEWKTILTNPLSKIDNTCAVLWHTEEGLQTRLFPHYAAAKAFYKEISPAYAKVLFREQEREDFYADASWTDWKSTFLNPFEESDRMMVYWHTEKGLERKFFSDLDEATKFYHTISPNYAKVLWHEEERVHFYAGASWDSWAKTFLCPFQEGREVAVLWHAEEGLEQKFFQEKDFEAAEEFYESLGNRYAKVLWRDTTREAFYAHASWEHWEETFACPYGGGEK